MQKNQQSVGLFARMLCSCFECAFVFILINLPVLRAPVITKLIFFSMRGTTWIHALSHESKRWASSWCSSSAEAGYFFFFQPRFVKPFSAHEASLLKPAC